MDDEDEVLLVMAQQLGGLVEAVGGGAHAHVLLEPLEALACVEDTGVREHAVSALNAVVASLPPGTVSTHAWPLTKRLGEKDWLTARASACSLLPLLYSRLEEGGGGAREEAFALYARLCSSEEVPVVRRSGALEFPAMASALAGGVVESSATKKARALADSPSPASAESATLLAAALGTDVEASPLPASPPLRVTATSGATGGSAATRLLPLAQAFSRDEQDGVRLLAVDTCVALARLANGGMTSPFNLTSGPVTLRGNGDVRSTVAGMVGVLAVDPAWRVRWSVAHRLNECAEALGPVHTSTALLPLLEALLGDGEAEVRCAAAYRVKDIAALVGKEVTVARIMGVLARVCEDGSDHVRAALASVILDLPPILGPEATAATLVPLFLRLIKDRSPHVRLNVISKLDAGTRAGGGGGGGISVPSLVASILPSLQELSSDKTWRVRLATISFMPGVMGQLGGDYLAGPGGRELVDMVIGWLGDPVFSIREAATASLKRLTELFGGAWADAVLLPRVLKIIELGGTKGGKAGGAGAIGVDGEGTFVNPNSPPSQLRMTGLMALVVSDAGGLEGIAAILRVFTRLTPVSHTLTFPTTPPPPPTTTFTTQKLGEAMSPAQVAQKILPGILLLSRDTVPNIRFNAAKALGVLVSITEPAVVTSKVRPALNLLASDSDADVSHSPLFCFASPFTF